MGWQKIVPPGLRSLKKPRSNRVNDTKTEVYVIKRNGCDLWKKCKLLGSLLDTTSDVNRRKSLAITAANNLKHIFNPNMDIDVKVRSFKCYVEPIFLYNSELWTTTSTIERDIDSFQRRLIRSYVLNITWPKIVKNDDLYEITKVVPWSKTVKKRQLSWFGHLMRLPDDSPAKVSLDYCLNHKTTRPRGRPMITWISMMRKRFEEMNTNWENASNKARNRDEWKRFMNSVLDECSAFIFLLFCFLP